MLVLRQPLGPRFPPRDNKVAKPGAIGLKGKALYPLPHREQAHGMSRERVNAICAGFPGAEVSDPWGGGHDAWKVGGKMFAAIGAVMPGVSVKTDSVETATMLIEAGVAGRAPYFHRSWVNVPFETGEEELRHRIATSYRLIVAGLPRKVRDSLAKA